MAIRVPPSVKVPELVIGPPEKLRPVDPPEALTLVTVPLPPPPVWAAQTAVPELTVKTYPLEPIGKRLPVFVPVPTIKSPNAAIGDKALNAAEEVVCPVPPLLIGSAVPLKEIANVPLVVMVDGLTLKNDGTVTPMLVTVPPPLPPPPVAGDHVAVVPVEVKTYPFVPILNRVALLVPLPIIKSPVEVMGERALNAADAVVCPVPPLAIFNVPVRVIALEVAELGSKPVVPALNVVTEEL